MDGALLGGVAVLERAIAYALGSLALVTPEAWNRPTPCRHWDLYDLLEHLHDSMGALGEAIEVGRVDPLPGAFGPDDRVIAVVRDRAVHLLGAWASLDQLVSVRVQDEPLTAPLLAGTGAIEVTVHGWDVARACGQRRPIPDELADELLDLAVLLVQGRDRPGRFGPPVRVPPDATPGDRLLAFLGRRPVWPGPG
jgi:uncharacterized protein (TIGR03086 family)